jgi:hypothetical protein
MAIWELKTVFQYGERFWENVWMLDIGAETDVPPAVVAAFEVFGIDTLLSLYELARIVRRPAGSADAFIVTPVGAAGGRSLGVQNPLPLFNTIRVLLGSGAGRPGIKFLRGLLLTADIIDNANHIEPLLIGDVQTALNTLLNALSDASVSLVEGAAESPVVTAEPQSRVQMRQQHRKRRLSV